MHLHHHTHPTEIKITKKQRIIMIGFCVTLVTTSILFSKWLMLPAGVWTGISWFFLMHYFLHQKWCVKIFPRLVNNHIIHHCKEPETCYGVSVVWWDQVFRTMPRKNKQIADRVIAFYYRKEKN
jgi:sterol desaturase/sphingolipid hydroxylase (fatty acid hydroxylase superfamily)